ncbi:MAG: hypothetical protein RLZZ546_1880 [Bacteroidota bacterium]
MTDNHSLKSRLKDFKLSGILASIDERLAYANGNSLSYREFIELLLEDEANKYPCKNNPVLIC